MRGVPTVSFNEIIEGMTLTKKILRQIMPSRIKFLFCKKIIKCFSVRLTRRKHGLPYTARRGKRKNSTPRSICTEKYLKICLINRY